MDSHVEKTHNFSRVVSVALIGIAILVVLVGGLFYANGGRFFIIQTPSMAEYAPVGTLVLSTPENFSEVKAGDMILFKPPATDTAYFHRVENVTSDGLETKGDLNGTVDPWRVNAGDLIGKELLHIQNLGFLLRVAPFLIVGGVALQLITRYFASRYYRFPLRFSGWYLLLSAAGFFSKPYFNATLVSQAVDGERATTTFVSTGVFDVMGTAIGGSSAVAEPGKLATVVSNFANDEGLYNVLLKPHLEIQDWIVVISIWILPLVACLIYTFVAKDEDQKTSNSHRSTEAYNSSILGLFSANKNQARHKFSA